MSEQVQPERLRELRDKALRYLRSNGAARPRGEVDVIELQEHLGTTPDEYRSLYMHFFNDGLARTNGSDSRMFLTKDGREEADRLDHKPSQAGITIQNNYGNVQVAGDNSTQAANQTFNVSTVTEVLNQIEQELPRLPLDESKRQEASGILAALRKVIVEKALDAGARVLAGALALILSDAGSTLGQTLLAVFGLSLGPG